MAVDAQPWSTPRSRAATRADLAAIDARHARHPACRLCGQRALKLDTFGLCSKNTVAHQARRGASAVKPRGRR
jgi:hypothetical protein